MNKKIFTIILFLPLFLSACSSESLKFVVPDIKDDFCGTHLNYQYCKCAFHNEFCEQIAMNASDAEAYVQKQYDAWLKKERQNFRDKCNQDNGVYENDKCKYCGIGKIVSEGKCIKEDDDGEKKDNIELEPGDCLSDLDCAPLCEGNIMWKLSCNTENHKCEKDFDSDCSVNLETFGDYHFPMICDMGACVRDQQSIDAERTKLELEQAQAKAKIEKAKDKIKEFSEQESVEEVDESELDQLDPVIEIEKINHTVDALINTVDMTTEKLNKLPK